MNEPRLSREDVRNLDSSINENNGETVDQSYADKLGSDDPFWIDYLKEAENYDDMMIKKWDKKMETLLLFATLFSAIVTAFVIESSQNLQPDNAAITATTIVEIAGILRNQNVGSQSGPFRLESPEEFQPSLSAFIVNFAWFISLCLSITVALLAGLVKQWCNMLLSDRVAPPCNQARIRQARFNQLIRWRTGLVISALPVIMDAALGLFLIGLLAFLRDLSYVIYLAAMTVTLFTAALYFGTTIAPCFVSFCPYETAISSRKAWGFCYQLCLAATIWVCKITQAFDVETEADLTNYLSPCEKRERKIANNTRQPDWLTGDALNWIILHSQKTGPREMAIRAIATLNSGEALKQLVSDPPVLRQVIQSFTSCFVPRNTEDGAIEFGFKKDIDINKASLHGQALTVLVTQILLANNREGNQVQAPFLRNNTESILIRSKWMVDPTTEEAVKIRFDHLTKSGSPVATVWALVGLSVWHDFIGYDTSLRFNQGKTVFELAAGLKWGTSMPSSLRREVLRALIKEISYWAPNVSSKHRRDTLECLIELVPSPSSPQKSQIRAPEPSPSELSQLSCALVVLVLNLNRNAVYPLLPNSDSMAEILDEEAGHGSKFAEVLMNYYAGKPDKLAKDGQSLLLFALTGLMEYYEHCDFDEEAHNNMKKIAERFQILNNLGKLQSIKVSRGAKSIAIDPRAYFVNILLLYLKLPRTPQHSHHIDEVSAHLLKSINHKRQSWELSEYGPQIIPLVTQALIQTTNVELQMQCLSTMISYWDSGPSLRYARIQLSHKVPLKLLHIIKAGGQELLQTQVSLVFQKIGKQVQHFTNSDQEKLAHCMRSVQGDLFEILVDTLHLREKLEAPQPQASSSRGELESSSGMPLLEAARNYLQATDEGHGPEELLLKKMIEAYDKDRQRRGELVAEAAEHWLSLSKKNKSHIVDDLDP